MVRKTSWLVLLVSCGAVGQYAHANAITDSGTLATANQGMWSAGANQPLQYSKFFGTQWGTYNNAPPESLSINLITGNEKTQVPGTGGTIPNPAYPIWQGALAACEALGASRSTCINGTSPVRVCAPSWLGGGCKTISNGIPGIGSEPPQTINNPVSAQYVDTRTGVAAQLLTSGETGIVPWVNASGGSVDAQVPFKAVISMPDNIQSGQAFTLSTSASINGTQITANAPSFKAGVDGVLNIDNTLSGTACVIFAGCTNGTPKTINLDAGQFGIVSIDTTQNNFLRVGGGAEGANSIGVPGIAFGNQYNFYAPSPTNPDGVDDPQTPQTLPTPKLGDFTVFNPQNFQGGTVTGGTATLTTNQNLLSVNASVTGLAELAAGLPGILASKISIVPKLLSIQYALLDVGVGPRFGVQQTFSLDPNLYVQLQFDKPVTRIDQGVATTYNNGIIDVALGDTPTLMFNGAVGQLLKRTYFLKNPQFSNVTDATIDPGLQVQLGCLSIPLVFPSQCIFNQNYQTHGLLGIPVWNNSWTLGGFNQLSFTSPLNPGVLPPIPTGGGSAQQVPEPSSLLLLGLGLALLGSSARLRKARAV